MVKFDKGQNTIQFVKSLICKTLNEPEFRMLTFHQKLPDIIILKLKYIYIHHKI